MNEQTNTTKVYAIIWEAPYEGQRTLGIYTSRDAAEAALQEYLTAEDDDYLSIKELALNEPAEWNYSE